MKTEWTLLSRSGFAELLASVADDAPHCIRGLSALRDPVLCAREIEIGVIGLFLRIIVPDDLDELPVAGAAAVCDDNLVVRALGGAFPAEADCNCQNLFCF